MPSNTLTERMTYRVDWDTPETLSRLPVTLQLTVTCFYRPHYTTALHDACPHRACPKRGEDPSPDLGQLIPPYRVR